MTLQVPFEGFSDAAHKIAGAKQVFVTGHPTGCVVTCADPGKGLHLVSVAHAGPAEATKCLEKDGFEVLEGIWSEDGQVHLESDPVSTAFVAAVSYISSEKVPGVWIDAYPDQPNHVQVLKAMYAEFKETGELADVTFEEFIRLANPNVVVVSASEVRGFIEAKASLGQ